MKTQIDEFDDNIYNIKNKDEYSFRTIGLTPEVIKEISSKKNEPEWMLELRLKALIYDKLPMPTWGPDLSELDMSKIATYVKPRTEQKKSWNDVPEDIKTTFDALGIPDAEKKSLAGVGAQYDSEIVYHSIKDELVKQGVIYTDFDTAVKEYPELVEEMKVVDLYFESINQMQNAVKNGGIIDGISSLLDTVIDKVKKAGLINNTIAKTIKQGKNIILNNVENNITSTFNKQYESIDYANKYISNWKENFEKKDFSGMEKEYKKIEKQLNNIAPIEKTINEAKTIMTLHNLIKNNGQNFNLSKEQLELAEKLK